MCVCVCVCFQPGQEEQSESDSEGIYEDLDPKPSGSEGGYESEGLKTSLFEWFKRGGERASAQRRHRLSKSVADLDDPDQDGYLLKRSATGLTWKRKWCVLKDYCLYYFK